MDSLAEAVTMLPLFFPPFFLPSTWLNNNPAKRKEFLPFSLLFCQTLQLFFTTCVFLIFPPFLLSREDPLLLFERKCCFPPPKIERKQEGSTRNTAALNYFLNPFHFEWHNDQRVSPSVWCPLIYFFHFLLLLHNSNISDDDDITFFGIRDPFVRIFFLSTKRRSTARKHVSGSELAGGNDRAEITSPFFAARIKWWDQLF